MKKTLREWLKIMMVVIMLFGSIKVFVLECIQINGNSMRPTLLDGERLIINKITYIISKPKRGDIIVFENKDNNKIIKRVIGLEGDTIEIIDGKIFVNDSFLKETYILEGMSGNFYKRVIPNHTVFVLGDNRNYSKDSRFKEIGFVSLKSVKGKCFFILWPLKSFRKI